MHSEGLSPACSYARSCIAHSAWVEKVLSTCGCKILQTHISVWSEHTGKPLQISALRCGGVPLENNWRPARKQELPPKVLVPCRNHYFWQESPDIARRESPRGALDCAATMCHAFPSCALSRKEARANARTTPQGGRGGELTRKAPLPYLLETTHVWLRDGQRRDEQQL